MATVENQGKKATHQEQEEIIDVTMGLVARLATKSEIRKFIETKFGKGWRQADRYAARAKAELRKRNSGLDVEAAKDLGLSTLFDVIRNGNPHNRLMAERRLSEIFGYNAPVDYRITTPPGSPLQMEDVTQVPVIPKDRMVQILGAIAATRAAGVPIIIPGPEPGQNGNGHAAGNGGANGNGNGALH
jgi:hypothetical protein